MTTNQMLISIRRFVFRALVVFFLFAPLLLLLSGGAFGQVDLMAVSVIVLGLWYGFAMASDRLSSKSEQSQVPR